MPQLDLKKLEEIHLDHGGHSSPEEGMCATEAISYIAGESFSDHPQCVSPVLAAFLRGMNDNLGDEDRQKLKPFLPRAISTASDGKDEQRGFLAADWLVHVATPTWLELAGAADAANTLRALPQITVETAPEAREVLSRIYDEAWERRRKALADLRERVREAVTKALQEKYGDKRAAGAAEATWAAEAAEAAGAAGAAEAAGAAWAAEAAGAAGAAEAAGAAGAAEAAGAAWAAEAAEATGAAWAAEAAGAAWATWAAEAAEAAGAAWATWAAEAAGAAGAAWAAELRRKVRERVRKVVREKLEEKLEPTKVELQKSAFELLEQLIDPGVREEVAA